MADAAIPPSGKRQSTGEEEQDAKKLKRGESEEEKEKIANEMMRKFRAEYNEDEEDLQVLQDLIRKFRAEYTGEGLWEKLLDYILDHLPAVVLRKKISEQNLEDTDEDTDEEIEFSSEERLSRKLYRDDKAGSPEPDYGPDDPLPEGYEWASMFPGTGGKDYVVKVMCCICFDDGHRSENCPRKDDPPFVIDLLAFRK